MKCIHIHIPKTAGSLFNQLLRQNFGSEFAHENPYLSSQHYTREDVLKMFDFYNFKVYAGHVFNLINTPFEEHPDLVAISFVREPINKYFSFYFYQRARPETRFDCAAKRLSLPDYIQWQLTRPSFHKAIDQDSGQLHWVTDGKGSIESVNELMRKRKYLVFPSERFDESIFILNHLFPKHFSNCYYQGKANESRRDQNINEELKAQVEKFSWIEDDKKFHAIANQNLDRLIVELFGDKIQFQKQVASFRTGMQNDPKKIISLGSKIQWKMRHWASRMLTQSK